MKVKHICFFLFVLGWLLWILKKYWTNNHKQDQNSVASKSRHYLSFNLPSIPNKHQIRIITYAGSNGTNTDTEIYSRIFQNSYIDYVDWDTGTSHPDSNTEVDINLYIEHIILSQENLFPCRRKWLMVNQELLIVNISQLAMIELFICKTLYAKMLLDELIKKHQLPGKTLYTKHTSDDLLLRFDSKLPDIPSKKENMFVHFAGKSWLKQTDKVLECWIDNKGFPQYNYPELHITCRDMCITRSTDMSRLLAEFVPSEKDGIYHHSHFKNIIWYQHLDTPDIIRLCVSAGCHIYPSSIEGYGHCINEARSAGSIVITVDAPPMNELISKDDGILISAKPIPSMHITGNTSSHPNSQACYIDTEDLTLAIHRYFSLSEPTKRQMRETLRKRYELDTEYMIQVLTKLAVYPQSGSLSGE
jgi:hypothetical protein